MAKDILALSLNTLLRARSDIRRGRFTLRQVNIATLMNAWLRDEEDVW